MKEKTENILIKISGDLIENEEVLKFVKDCSLTGYVVVIPGAGKQINKVFREANLKIKFGDAGRETNFKGRQISRDILEENQRLLQNKFIKEGINANIEIPIIYIGGVLCSVNGDDFIINAYNSFDKIYVITILERVKEKEKKFVKFLKIKIMGIKEV